jgi:hypothetical protein
MLKTYYLHTGYTFNPWISRRNTSLTVSYLSRFYFITPSQHSLQINDLVPWDCVTRWIFILKAHNNKQVLSVHALMVFTIFLFLSSWKNWIPRFSAPLKSLTKFEKPSSNPLQRPWSGNFDTENAQDPPVILSNRKSKQKRAFYKGFQ